MTICHKLLHSIWPNTTVIVKSKIYLLTKSFVFNNWSEIYLSQRRDLAGKYINGVPLTDVCNEM